MTRLGALIVTYGRPAILGDCLSALGGSRRPPDITVVVDNSPDCWPDPPAGIRYLWSGRNLGLPGGIALGLRSLAGADHVLILDDDTVLSEDAIGLLLEPFTDPTVGVVAVPGPFTRKCASADPPTVVPWSPSVFSRTAIEAAGAPREDLFFGWCDWEYATRVVRAGYRVVWVDIELPVQSLERNWLGRKYLSSRNTAYLVTRRKVDEPYLRRHLAQLLRVAARAPASDVRRAQRRGLVDGLVGRLGPPPVDFMPRTSQVDRRRTGHNER